MQKQAPSVFQLATIAGFALSCFGILLFLWITFGGPTPLKAKGYTFKVPFTEAGLLAVQSDVRISGVSVGKVTKIELGSGKDAGRAVATVTLNDRYAPIPVNTRALLRQKTLLGETYVELTPADRNEPKLPDGGALPAAQVSQAVQLDEIFRTFNGKTRVAFKNWMLEASQALAGRGADLNDAIGLLNPTFTDANKVLRILDTQRLAVRQLVRNTGVVFSALSARQGDLRSLIENSNAVFSTTAARNRDLQNFFVVLPTFEQESTATLERLDRFAANTDPLVQQLRPAARDLAPALTDVKRLAPQLQQFFVGLKPVIAAAPNGFPALRKFLGKDLPPLLGRLDPFFAQLDPLLQELALYKHEITSFVANAAVVTNTTAVGTSPETNGRNVAYLRTAVPLGPDSVSVYPQRLRSNRTNPYMQPLGYRDLGRGGLFSFETGQCSGGINAIYRLWTELSATEQATFTASTNQPDAAAGQDLYDRLRKYSAVDTRNTNDLPAPPCRQQAPYQPLGNSNEAPSRYQHVFPGG
jgi:phospholipid/cholesterol/gamma-HCH transport system substrate-binding protein